MSAVACEHTDECCDECYERYETAYDLIEELRVHIAFRLVDGKVRIRPASALSDHAKSELRRVKAEVAEILREEDEREAAWEQALAAAPETDVMPDAEYDEFDELPNDQQSVLFRWIGESLETAPEKTERYRHDSYELKHVFARAPEGFYTTDAQFRAAMWLSGFPGRRCPVRRRRNEADDIRYYYVRPNREGLIRKLEANGVPYGWAVDAIMQPHSGAA